MEHESDDDRRDEPSLELPELRLPRFNRPGRRAVRPDSTQNGAGSRTTTRPTPARPRLPQLPTPPGPAAAAATGGTVGAFGTVLTYLAMTGCEAVRGTSSCGGPGLLLLLAILTLMILLGATLLKAFGVAEPGSTSFLAVGVVAVIVLLVLLESIFSGWMFLVVPTVAAASYLLAHWVTARFGEDS